MYVFCDRLKFGSTEALDCRNDQNKDRYHEKELLLLLNWLSFSIMNSNATKYEFSFINEFFPLF